MDKSKTKRVGILSLFLREEDLAYYLDPDRWSAAERENLALHRMMAAYHQENSDLKIKVETLSRIPGNAGEAKAKKYQGLRSFCLEIYVNCCLDRMVQTKLISLLDSASPGELMTVVRKIQPPFKVFATAFHSKATLASWNEFEKHWLKTPAAEGLPDSTLHGWWKDKNAELKRVIEAYMITGIDD